MSDEESDEQIGVFDTNEVTIIKSIPKETELKKIL